MLLLNITFTPVTGKVSLEINDITLNSFTNIHSKIGDITEDETQMVNEPAMSLYTGTSIADALWALIVNQSEEVQSVIAELLNHLLSKTNRAVPYTMEEINSRIDESEAQMMAGEVLPGEEVHDKMRQYINNLAV